MVLNLIIIFSFQSNLIFPLEMKFVTIRINVRKTQCIYDYATLDAPSLLWSRKLSRDRLAWYQDGRKREKRKRKKYRKNFIVVFSSKSPLFENMLVDNAPSSKLDSELRGMGAMWSCALKRSHLCWDNETELWTKWGLMNAFTL